jgi:hypothetical protein
MEPDDLQCSRNARPQKALVGRAQWKINQPPSLERERASLEELVLSLAVALPAERCVLARRGWVRTVAFLSSLRAIEVLPCRNSFPIACQRLWGT